MRTNLQVPFAEKDQAKRLGARWDAARKLWYVENAADLSPFTRWLPITQIAQMTASAGAAALKSPAARNLQTTGITVVGSAFVEHPRVCDCLPWNVCDKCGTTALRR